MSTERSPAYKLGSTQLRQARLNARNALERAGKLDFKPITSAKWVNVRRSWSGKLHVCVEHDTIRGVTPEMMHWWFANSSRVTKWDGVTFDNPDAPEISFYHLWHHRDHGSVIPKNPSATGLKTGETFNISEQFNDYKEVIEHTVHIDQLDDRAFVFRVKQFGFLPVCRLDHFYDVAEGGCSFYAETVVGLRSPIFGWFVNWFIVPWIYNKTTAEHWIKHNIEEVGRSEDIIPVLYKQYAQADKKT